MQKASRILGLVYRVVILLSSLVELVLKIIASVGGATNYSCISTIIIINFSLRARA